MITRDTLAGYLLEELLASLMQSAGYKLLTDSSQDPYELDHNRGGDLLVKGRGGKHQVDVLGEFLYVPAFSQPIRLFVEAKARNRAVGLPLVRNAVGTIIDVNEAWMIDYSTNRARRHYKYALFSSSGFSSPAQDYALAHQVSLIDLSGPEWNTLIDIVRHAATDLIDAHVGRTAFPVRQLRQAIRYSLGTMPDGQAAGMPTDSELADEIVLRADYLANAFREAFEGALLVFPATSQVQLARPDDLADFLAYAGHAPEHRVTLSVSRNQRVSRQGRTWVVRPLDSSRGSYALRVTLPAYRKPCAC